MASDPCSHFAREQLLGSVTEAAAALPEIVFCKAAPFLADPAVVLVPTLNGFVVSFGAALTFIPGPIGSPTETKRLERTG